MYFKMTSPHPQTIGFLKLLGMPRTCYLGYKCYTLSSNNKTKKGKRRKARTNKDSVITQVRQMPFLRAKRTLGFQNQKKKKSPSTKVEKHTKDYKELSQ